MYTLERDTAKRAQGCAFIVETNLYVQGKIRCGKGGFLDEKRTLPPSFLIYALGVKFSSHAVLHIRDFRCKFISFTFAGTTSTAAMKDMGARTFLGLRQTWVDYTFSCGTPFLNNMEPTEFYQARWKKQDRKLELLMQRVGSDHVDKCQLNTSVKQQPYGTYGAVAPSMTSTSSAAPDQQP